MKYKNFMHYLIRSNICFVGGLHKLDVKVDYFGSCVVSWLCGE